MSNASNLINTDTVLFDWVENCSFSDPLFVIENSRAVLIGLTSWGFSCQNQQLPTEYARVSSAVGFVEASVRRCACGAQSLDPALLTSEGPSEVPAHALPFAAALVSPGQGNPRDGYLCSL